MTALANVSPEAINAYTLYSHLVTVDHNTVRAHAYRLMPEHATPVEIDTAWEIAITAWFSRQKRVA